MAVEAVYTLDNLRQIRDGAEILSLSHLDVPRGIVTAVLGPSGAGKTTLMRLLAILEPPAEGRLSCFGLDPWLQGVPAAATELRRVTLRRRLALVSQRPLLFSGTVAANVGYGLKLRALTRDQAHERIEQALDFCGLTPFARRAARTLSGGEQQRVALARALALSPEVLLLDEPTANLDPASVAAIEQVVAAAVAERHITVIIVTHNVGQARRLAGECAFLAGGRLIERGPAGEFFANPRTPEAQAFLSGAMIY